MGLSAGVVGAGIVGLSTALALRDRGASVTVYERGEPGGGQSAGETRIFRLAHGDAGLVELAARSRERWLAWGERAGQELLAPHGVVIAGPAAAERAALLREAGFGVRDARAEDLPIHAGLAESGGFTGDAIHDEGGGPLRTRRAIAWLAGELGGAMRRAEVLGVRLLAGGGAGLLSPSGTFRHDAVVVCAGPDTPRLAAQVGIELPVAQSLHLRCTFATHAPGRLACLQDGSGDFGETVYGSPLPAGDGYAVGLAGPDGLVTDAAGAGLLRERVIAYVRRAMPGLRPEPTAEVFCRVTQLPWGDDAFAAWQAGAVTALAGNNLFKHAPLLGELLADAALTSGVPAALAPPAPDR